MKHGLSCVECARKLSGIRCIVHKLIVEIACRFFQIRRFFWPDFDKQFFLGISINDDVVVIRKEIGGGKNNFKSVYFRVDRDKSAPVANFYVVHGWRSFRDYLNIFSLETGILGAGLVYSD